MSRSTLPRNLLAISLVSLFTDASSEMIYPLLPNFMVVVLGVSTLSLGFIEGVAESTSSMLKLLSGAWSDRLSKRKPLVVAGYTLSSVLRPLVGIAQSGAHVFAIRIGDRVGKGLRSAPRDALLADSVESTRRGWAFGVHRGADHFGAVVGPLIAWALLQWTALSLRAVFLAAAIPAAIAMGVLIFGVKDHGRALVAAEGRANGRLRQPLGRAFYTYLGVLFLFTLGNSADAFLLLRAKELGVPLAQLPLLWSALHVVKSTTAGPGGALSDRFGRRPLIVAGWLVFALAYAGLAYATEARSVWLLFGLYGCFFGLTEGSEKALVVDLVAPEVRGRAFGWYNGIIGIGALPASLLCGLIWQNFGASAALGFGAALALLASVLLLTVVPPHPGQLRNSVATVP